MNDFEIKKQNAKKVIEEWKSKCFDVYVVSDILKELRIINPVDFYAILQECDDVQELYEEVESSINMFLEDVQKKYVFSNDKPNSKLLSTMIEANNKRKYWKKIDKEDSENEHKTKEDLSNDISKLLEELKNRDKLKRQ